MENGDEPFEPEAKPLDGEELTRAERLAASHAFRSAMPMLISKAATRAYIACVAAGTQDGIFTDRESKTLAYTAQLALSAWKLAKK